MGVNTLAFRLAQHGTFFSVDADCVAHTDATPWEMDSQFLDLVARSGTSLFVSANPRATTREQKTAFSSAMHIALAGGAEGQVEPLDWLHNTTPRNWRIGKNIIDYRWEEPSGAIPFQV